MGSWGGGGRRREGVGDGESVPAACCSSQQRCLGHRTCLWREEIDGPRSVSIFLNEASVILGAWSSIALWPPVFTVVSQAVDVAAEVQSIAAPTVHSMTLVTHLTVQHIWINFNLLVNVSIGDLEEPTRYGTHETDPRKKGHSTSNFGVFQVQITVNASVAQIVAARYWRSQPAHMPLVGGVLHLWR